jgi:hypothetical protein
MPFTQPHFEVIDKSGSASLVRFLALIINESDEIHG